MEVTYIIILIFAVLTFLVLVLLFYINKLIIYRNKVDYAYDAVCKLMDERMELMDRFSNFVQTELENENNLVIKLRRLQKEYLHRKRDVKYVKKTSKYLVELKKLDKVYLFLKDKSLYKDLSSLIDTNQDRIEYAMDSYDKEVHNYNNYISNKFILFLKSLFKFPDYDYYNK